jgi:hypothetical protein
MNALLNSALSSATENSPYAELGIRAISICNRQVSVKLSVQGQKSDEKFWRVMAKFSLVLQGSLLHRVYRLCSPVLPRAFTERPKFGAT